MVMQVTLSEDEIRRIEGHARALNLSAEEFIQSVVYLLASDRENPISEWFQSHTGDNAEPVPPTSAERQTDLGHLLLERLDEARRLQQLDEELVKEGLVLQLPSPATKTGPEPPLITIQGKPLSETVMEERR